MNSLGGQAVRRKRDEKLPIIHHEEKVSPEDKQESVSIPSDLRGDYLNIALLLLLYILQGIPLGLIASIPYILTNRGISYSQQAIFSFVIWPFSLKLLWAPVVDSVYCERIGRRKSWLVPIQYLIGGFMIVLSYFIEGFLNNSKDPDIILLTGIFLVLNFLAATQDIAVDGWALTMLKPSNVGYASTCNTVGQTAGYFLGNVVFLALESADFANKYFRSSPKPYGLIDLQGFFYFWGLVFLVVTTFILIFKKESRRSSHMESEDMSIKDTYRKLLQIFNLPAIRRFTYVLLTCKIGFAVTDSSTGLKLIEAGVHKENLALLAIPLVPLQILLPWFISRYTNGPKPLDVFMKAYPYRLMFGLVFAVVVWWTRTLKTETGEFPAYYYLGIVIIYALHQLSIYSMFVSITSFHAKVSDPAIGGTYMTFLNTITNLGGNWPATISLWFVERLTVTSCNLDESPCKMNASDDQCSLNGGVCQLSVDGYYLETIICIVIGFFWFLWGRRQIALLQNLSPQAWRSS